MHIVKWQRIKDSQIEAYECHVSSAEMAERAAKQFRPKSKTWWQYEIDHCTDGTWRVQMYDRGVPDRCDSCGKQADELTQKADWPAKNGKAPMVCDECLSPSKQVFLGLFRDLGGEEYYVIADSERKAKAELMRVWKRYDRLYGSDYHGRVKAYRDLEDIYGVCVVRMPWNKASWYGNLGEAVPE